MMEILQDMFISVLEKERESSQIDIVKFSSKINWKKNFNE